MATCSDLDRCRGDYKYITGSRCILITRHVIIVNGQCTSHPVLAVSPPLSPQVQPRCRRLTFSSVSKVILCPATSCKVDDSDSAPATLERRRGNHFRRRSCPPSAALPRPALHRLFTVLPTKENFDVNHDKRNQLRVVGHVVWLGSRRLAGGPRSLMKTR